MRIIITGVNGFTGSHLLRYFAGMGHEIIAFGRQEHPNAMIRELAEYRVFGMENTSIEGITEADVCIHAAASTSTTISIDQHIKTNVDGTANLLKAIKVKQFIYVSTSSVYSPGIFLKEEDANITNKDLSAYGKSKLLTELMLIEQCQNSNTSFEALTIFRPRAIYGKGDRQLLAKLLRLVKQNYLFWPGNQETISSLTHIDNLCYACSLAIRKAKIGCSIYNICDAGEYQLYHTVKPLLESISKRKLIPIPLPINLLLPILKLIYRANGKYFELQQLNAPFTLDLSKIMQELDYVPEKQFNVEEIRKWYTDTKAKEYPSAVWPWL